MKRSYKLIMLSLIILISFFILSNLNNKNTKPIINEEDKSLWIYNRNFNDNVVFYPQHQDDEVLWAGSCIIRAIEKCGPDNVYVVLVSDGTGVNIFKNIKYKNLTRKEKEELRNNEFKEALKFLGIKDNNIIILSELDNESVNHFDLMKELALYYEDKLVNVTHVAHSYKYDDHPMHKKNGKVIKNLYDENKINDVMYFIKPKYKNKIDNSLKVLYTAQTLQEYDKNIDGIGYESAHSYFDRLMNDPNLPSILHLPLK